MKSTAYVRVDIAASNPQTAALRRNIDAGRLPANARCWEKDVEDGRLRVIRTLEQHDEGGRWIKHISISHSGPDLLPGRYPTWDEQKEAVWAFAPGVPMYSILPPEGDPYINLHSTTFHWWEEV